MHDSFLSVINARPKSINRNTYARLLLALPTAFVIYWFKIKYEIRDPTIHRFRRKAFREKSSTGYLGV